MSRNLYETRRSVMVEHLERAGVTVEETEHGSHKVNLDANPNAEGIIKRLHLPGVSVGWLWSDSDSSTATIDSVNTI